MDPITRLAYLVAAGRAERADGPYEVHYPAVRARFVAMVEARMRVLGLR